MDLNPAKATPELNGPSSSVTRGKSLVFTSFCVPGVVRIVPIIECRTYGSATQCTRMQSAGVSFDVEDSHELISAELWAPRRWASICSAIFMNGAKSRGLTMSIELMWDSIVNCYCCQPPRAEAPNKTPRRGRARFPPIPIRPILSTACAIARPIPVPG